MMVRSFVPKHLPCNDSSVQKLQEFIANSKKLFVLTGAGVSTESGIPDYRSEEVGLYARSEKKPILYKVFVESYKARQSYWARNFVGWPRFSSFQPNISHTILADWEEKRKIHCIVTQNVDRLHHKAGSKFVIELHGSAYQVICLSCSLMSSRHIFQDELLKLNSYLSLRAGDIRPDGDVDLSEEEVSNFEVPDCLRCGGILKPHIVFFGDNVPKARVTQVKDELASCDSFLALGTTFTVFSAFRYILLASDLKMPIAVVNIGDTRGDKLSTMKLKVRCGEILPQITI